MQPLPHLPRAIASSSLSVSLVDKSPKSALASKIPMSERKKIGLVSGRKRNEYTWKNEIHDEGYLTRGITGLEARG